MITNWKNAFVLWFSYADEAEFTVKSKAFIYGVSASARKIANMSFITR